jgi:CubicO group peptidase (beta-lactamase class C family)
MRKDEPDISSAASVAGEPKSSFTQVIKKLKKEAEKKEYAVEGTRIRCGICFREIAPQRVCGGHGGGGGGSSGADSTAEKRANQGGQSQASKPAETLDEKKFADDFYSIEESLDSQLQTDVERFDSEIIAELVAKGLLLIDNDRESMTLTVKLQCEPNSLSKEQRHELKKFMGALLKELNDFKEINHLSDDGVTFVKDTEGNVLSIRITLPTIALYDAFIQRLANNLLPAPNPKLQTVDDVKMEQCSVPDPLLMEQKRADSMEKSQELMGKVLDNANIPALSLSWCQKGTRYAVASGSTDTSAPNPVDTNTLFQASSLSKPVSAAIVLDLVAQNQWDLDTPLAEYAPFGSPELQQDPRYSMLTTRMVIGQCSGLPNGDDAEQEFIATPNTQFTYSGMALDFLKQVIEATTQKKWETIAQEFFTKARMESSTFKQVPASHLSGTRDVARSHEADGSPRANASIDSPEVLAASLLTTAKDYIAFLQHCFNNDFLRSTLMTGVLSGLPPMSSTTAQVQWGLGMGIYSDSVSNQTIAFHHGNNPGSNAFFAMDMATGDCVTCLSNSANGPFVFQQVVEPIVGDMTSLFQWLYNWFYFRDASTPKAPDSIAKMVHSIHTLAKEGSIDTGIEVRQHYKNAVDEVHYNGQATGTLEGTGLSESSPTAPIKGEDHQASSSFKLS